MKQLTLFISILALTASFSSCVKETGTQTAQLSYSFGATNLTAPLSGNRNITWTAMTVNISKVQITARLAGKEVALESNNLFSINPLQPDVLLGTTPIAAGIYENVRFKLTMAESASNPPFLLTGTFTEESGTKVPVIVQLNQSKLFTLEAAKFEIIKGSHVAKVNFQLNNLVSGLTGSDFGQTTRSGSDNTILVNSTTNRALFEKLSMRLANISSVTVN